MAFLSMYNNRTNRTVKETVLQPGNVKPSIKTGPVQRRCVPFARIGRITELLFPYIETLYGISDCANVFPKAITKTILFMNKWLISNIEIISKWQKCSLLTSRMLLFISTHVVIAIKSRWYTEPLMCGFERSPYILRFVKTTTNEDVTD